MSQKILLRLLSGFGLGDCLQFGIILKHLAKHRPDWTIDVAAPRGAASSLMHLCNQLVYDYAAGAYDKVLDLHITEQYADFKDRPDTKMAAFLVRTFGIEEYDETLGRYECHVSDNDLHRAQKYLRTVCSMVNGSAPGAVLVHYQGGSHKYSKDLTDWQAKNICDVIRRAGRTPVILDFSNRSPLVDQQTIFSPRVSSDDIWGGFGNGDASIIAGMIQSSEAFVGIDSGPGKLASATTTPTLIIWTKHHPCRYHDPAPNTLHLVPETHKSLPGWSEYFETHYRYQTYNGPYGLAAQAQRWLARTLCWGESMFRLAPKWNLDVLTGIQFVIPNDLESVLLAFTKIRHIAQGRPIDVILTPRIPLEAAQFVKRFRFVRNASTDDLPLYLNPSDPTNTRGQLVFVSDGIRGDYHYLLAKAVLQEGRPIEDWVPEYPVDREFMRDYQGPVPGEVKEAMERIGFPLQNRVQAPPGGIPEAIGPSEGLETV